MVAAESAQRKADAATQLDAPLITFVMPCYNSAKFMRNGIESLLKIEQSCEIILINDGSSDNTGDIAQEYAESYQNVVAINQENSNWGGVVNHGIRRAAARPRNAPGCRERGQRSRLADHELRVRPSGQQIQPHDAVSELLPGR